MFFFSSSAVHYQIKNTHREKVPSSKIQHLQKVRIWAFGSLVHQTEKEKNQENKVVLAKLRSLLTILFILTLASDMAVLHGHDALSILVLSTMRFQY